MPGQSELLTPAEAAVVADVSVRDVHRVIDEHILPESFYSLEGGRWLKSSACTYVRFYFHAAKALTADQRCSVIHVLTNKRHAAKGRRWTVEDTFLTIDLSPFVAETDARHATLMRAREMVVEDPEILRGTPVLRGTRIPVYDIAAAMAGGLSSARLKAAYPGLDDERIALASLYAEANPPRGRPRARAAPHAGLELLSERKTPRRRRG